jgi:hypothetical protein
VTNRHPEKELGIDDRLSTLPKPNELALLCRNLFLKARCSIANTKYWQLKSSSDCSNDATYRSFILINVSVVKKILHCNKVFE